MFFRQNFEMKPRKNGIWLTVNGLGSPTPFLLILPETLFFRQNFEMKSLKNGIRLTVKRVGSPTPFDKKKK
jgi:hypothetical protein